MTDFFPAGRTRYPGRNAEEKTILLYASLSEIFFQNVLSQGVH